VVGRRTRATQPAQSSAFSEPPNSTSKRGSSQALRATNAHPSIKRRRENNKDLDDDGDVDGEEDEDDDNEIELHVCPFSGPRPGFAVCKELGEGRKSIKAVSLPPYSFLTTGSTTFTQDQDC
jgi:hypothetical protein